MWKIFSVEMKLAQPLAIGPGWRLGFVMLTRLDVPPRTFWGAFTDALTRWKLAEPGAVKWLDTSSSGSGNEFEKMGRWVSKNLRFLPGTLLLKEGKEVKERVLPWYLFGEGERFSICNKDVKNLRYETLQMVKGRYVAGRGSTALEYKEGSMAAEEGMLHETERIMPRIGIDGKICDVWVEMVIFVLSEAAAGIQKWIKDQGKMYLRVGRDVGVGDGCFDEISVVELDEKSKIGETRCIKYEQKTEWNLESEDGPILSVTPQAGAKEGYARVRLQGPFLVDKDNGLLKGYWGELRPHLIREFDTGGQGFGRKMGYPDDANNMWILEHGGILAADKHRESYRFILKRDGWQLAPDGDGDQG